MIIHIMGTFHTDSTDLWTTHGEYKDREDNTMFHQYLRDALHTQYSSMKRKKTSTSFHIWGVIKQYYFSSARLFIRIYELDISAIYSMDFIWITHFIRLVSFTGGAFLHNQYWTWCLLDESHLIIKSYWQKTDLFVCKVSSSQGWTSSPEIVHLAGLQEESEKGRKKMQLQPVPLWC